MSHSNQTRTLVLTPATLISISISGKCDEMKCLACNVSEPIPFEYLGASQYGEKGKKLSLVLNPVAREAEIRAFKKHHLETCLLLSGDKLKTALKKV